MLKMNADYLRLRRRIFQQELWQLNEQIKKLGVIIVAFLGTALPVAFFAVLLGFGIVLKNDVPPSESLMIIWCLLLVQSMLLMLLKKAILGSGYRLYLNSINPSVIEQHFSTLVYCVLCQPLLIIHLYIIANINVSDWQDVPHGFLLLGLQVLCAFCVIAHMRTVYWFLGLSFIWVLIAQLITQLITGVSLLSHLWITTGIFGLAFMGAYYVRGQSVSIQHMLPIKLRIWSMHLVNQHGVILWLISTCLLVAILCRYSALQMPHYASGIYFIGAQILVLVFASAQLLMNRLTRQHEMFFSPSFMHPSIVKAQVLLPLFCGILGLLTFGLIQTQIHMGIAVLNFLTLGMCMWVAKNFEKWFMPASVFIALVAAVFVYFML